MIWLIVFNWFQLLLAFVLGLAAARWIMGRPGSVGREDLFAELAAERTKRHEAEADRARERARAAEFERKLHDLRREVRLGVHDAPPPADGESAAPAAVERPASTPIGATRGKTSDGAKSGARPTAQPAAAPPATDGLSARDVGAHASPAASEATALTAIDGVTSELAERLQAEGVTVADIAGWSADDVERFEALLETAGEVAARDWVGQAQTLVNVAAPPARKAARKGATG